MIWVVDALRRTTDRKQFNEVFDRRTWQSLGNKKIERISGFEARLVEEWGDLQMIVAFDFGQDGIWLMSGRDRAFSLGFFFSKEELIKHILDGTQIPFVVTEHRDRRRSETGKRTHTVPRSLLRPGRIAEAKKESNSPRPNKPRVRRTQ